MLDYNLCMCITYRCLFLIFSPLVSAPAVTVLSDISAMIVTDGQPVNFTCNVTTPVNGAEVIWLDGNGKWSDTCMWWNTSLYTCTLRIIL